MVEKLLKRGDFIGIFKNRKKSTDPLTKGLLRNAVLEFSTGMGIEPRVEKM